VRIGDLVRNLNSEMGMTGVIVGWSTGPVVLWADGSRSWIMAHRVSVVL